VLPPSLLRCSSPASMDGDRSTARDALRAASASLADGITRLRVASAVRGGGAPPEEGESFVTARAGGAHRFCPAARSCVASFHSFCRGGSGYRELRGRGVAWGSAPFCPRTMARWGGPSKSSMASRQGSTPLSPKARGASSLAASRGRPGQGARGA
jgi:hypothetical protein